MKKPILNISSKLPDTGTSIFTVMSRMAMEHGAINLSQGFPDFAVSEELVELIHKYMREGHNQYAPMPGAPALKSVIAGVVQKTYGRQTDPDKEIVIMAGATESIYSTIAALVQPGDEVIIFDPSYDSYAPSVMLNGGTPVSINLHPPTFAIDWAEVQTKITRKTKLIIVNTPHNPSGAVLSEGDMHALEAIVLKHGVFVLSDEVYERIIFDGYRHESVLKYPGLASQSIAVFSFGKTFHATGWKIGYTVASPAVTDEIRKAHQFVTFAVNTPIQLALAEYMKDEQHYLHLGSFFQKKRDFFLSRIKGSSFEPLPCHGTYFQVMSYRNISKKKEVEMAEWMTKECKVASIPLSVFYGDKTDGQLLRFCFAKKEETLENACAILKTL